MKKYLFAALAFMALVATGCSDEKGDTEKTTYAFESAHLSFTLNLEGDIAPFVEVIPSTTLPTSDGMASSSSDGTKHTIFISNIKCPSKFDVVYILKPKKSAAIDENTKYSYKATYDYTLTRNFDDGSHIVGSTGTSSEMSGTIAGKDAAKFFEIYGTSTFSFKITHDGYVDETSDEE